MNRASVRLALAAAALALLVLPAAAKKKKRKSAPPPDPSKAVAEVVRVEGGTLAAGKSKVGPGYRVPPGGRLEAGRGARAWLAYGDEGNLLLEGPGSIEFEQGGRQLYLPLGRLLSSLSSLRSPFRVRTRGDKG